VNEDLADAEADELRRELHVIEELPLDQRSSELSRLHDRLRSRLEGGDAPLHGS
jgi:hypothetical protein